MSQQKENLKIKKKPAICIDFLVFRSLGCTPKLYNILRKIQSNEYFRYSQEFVDGKCLCRKAIPNVMQ